MHRLAAIAIAGTLIGAACGGTLLAQTPSLTDQRTQLASANKAAQDADARARSLQTAAASERDEAKRARTREAAVAARIQAAEAQIAAARARIDIVDRMLGLQRVRLAEQQGPVARLIAALQSLARRPALLGLVQPGSTADIVHVRAALSAVAPVVHARTGEIRAEVERTRRLRDGAQLAERSLSDGRARLQNERLALVKMEAEHSLRSADYRRGAMFESDRALALGEQARDLVDLMDTMGAAAETRAALESLPGPLPRPGVEGAEAPAPVTRSAAPPPYRLPVAGQVVTGLGELSAEGVRSRGLTLATWPGAQVVAPTGGRVIYAGRFRRYRNIVILDHGAGWTSLVAGLDRVLVRVGDQLVQGSSLGRAPQGDAPRVMVELRRQGRPVDLAQLLD
ncbi:peptidoglycan DD-metalloendopeptidase family protein [Sphingomonas sp. MG17]|uniref:Peptidoglycan DD-metalloendopeptidase family protein n=1 Tax=Sphingomonas tagetis TaxID=2949092 RepID=A0A9X2HG30_9SPHN|nr:peptidoglycan DD-metalloendopeptidase family protein [Sphingomonas tagetis]MCP3730471.1 peptidoglycan DD-metalloendopeptidase family protein [Sphingomonas tagetis]